MTNSNEPLVHVDDATMAFGARVLWEHLDLEAHAGELLAVLGPNGAGKSTLLDVLLGITHLTAGTVEVMGAPAGRRPRAIGYVPQQKAFPRDLPIRGRDLVRLGLDGHRYGVPLRSTRVRTVVDTAIAAVGASEYADRPIGTLSGGEQQRLRVAQAVVGEPQLLLCDEPLLSLDLAQQHAVTALIDTQRNTRGCGVVFVTHDINPVLDYVDRVLYIVDGRWAVGAASEVMHSEQLSRLYGTPVDVLELGGRLVVVGAHDSGLGDAHDHHHHDEHEHLHAHDVHDAHARDGL
ncbi:MAG TPA: ABC transporter ATP-binding protein [Acidimicrobiia bacterium]|jgi:zinc/manganese transport system ATP-binding protein